MRTLRSSIEPVAWRRKFAALTLCLGLLAIGAPPASAVPPGPNLCPTTRPTLYDVTMSVSNSVDRGTAGNVWAKEQYLQHVRVWKIGQQHYCFVIEYDGTWTSVAGVSPGGTGTIPDGITGTWHGVRLARLTGQFNPQYPLSGHVADFDRQCGTDGVCTGRGPSFAMYFSPIVHVNIVWHDFLATSANNGSWHLTPYGEFGDITG